MYGCDFADADNGRYDHSLIVSATISKSLALPTITEMEARYARREIVAAKVSRVQMQRAGFPSELSLKHMLKRGSNPPVLPQDVDRARRIYGPDVYSRKGKAVRTKSIIVDMQKVEPRLVRTVYDLHADIMFIDNIPFLVSVSTPNRLLMAERLSSRTAHELQTQLNCMIRIYGTFRFKLRALLFDGKKAY